MSDSTLGPTHVLSPATRQERVVYDRFVLTVASGPDKGLRREFGQATVEVGTARANDLVLTDRTVSRFHLKIETHAGQFTLLDLESTNGTMVGGVRIRAVFLDAAVGLQLGTTTLAFEPLGDQTALELPADDHMGAMIGRSSQMRLLFGQVAKVAPSDLSVVIEGETGSGKELVAHLIHERSPRAAKPFEVLDCSTIPDHLVESELFGHVKGAFTGADRDHVGIFERAEGGTVFLDEIGELTSDLQPKLLRVLESREIRKVGDAKTRRVDVRLVAATHRSLRALVNKGTFREDLYYRLAGCTLDLPPLRERLEDIPLLVEHFLERLKTRDPTRTIQAPDDETLRTFATHPWPGNVRQLKNAVERLAVMGSAELGGDSPASGAALSEAAAGVTHLSMRDAKEAFERAYLEALVRRHGGDAERAAAVAEVHPKSLLRMLRRHAIERP